MSTLGQVISLLLVVAASGYSQPPSPTPTVKSDQPKAPSATRQQHTNATERGTEQAPIVVKIAPSPKTKQEAAQDENRALDQSAANWWMVRVTFAVFIVGLIQTVVFAVQAWRLKQTIDKMDEVSGKQTKDIRASIAEATRSATAMEGIADSMASNVTFLRGSLEISREIANTQQLIIELQSRAYLVVVFDSMMPQITNQGIRFEPRMKVVNKGNTPAQEIRFAMAADAQPMPLSPDFAFPLPTDPLTASGGVLGPGLHKTLKAVVPQMFSEPERAQLVSGIGRRIIAWGIIRYKDVIGKDRYVRFGVTFFCVGDNKWMSEDTARHNESD
jgi:hypothetical protein